MSNVSIFQISVVLMISSNHVKCYRDIKIYKKIMFLGVWTESRNAVCFLRLSEKVPSAFSFLRMHHNSKKRLEENARIFL